MNPLVETLNFYLALGTVGLQVAGAYIAYAYYRGSADIRYFIRTKTMLSVWVLTTIGSVLTLVYSDVFGFIPCGLCWFQRIALYPIAFLSGIALLRRETIIVPYLMYTALFGALVALYHHYIQMGGAALGACPAAGGGADCAERILFEFGYITYPLMSLTTFLFVALLLFLFQKSNRVEDFERNGE